MNNLTQAVFDYSVLSTEIAIEIRSATEEVKLFLRMSAEGIIRAGKKLIQIKDKLSHGQFIQWVEIELNISRSTANHFIQVANKFDGEMSNYSTFAPTILYALSAPSTPDAIVDQAIDKANTGEKVTVDDVQEWKLKYRQISALNEANEEANVRLRVMLDHERKRLTPKPPVKETITVSPADYEETKLQAEQLKETLDNLKT